MPERLGSEEITEALDKILSVFLFQLGALMDFRQGIVGFHDGFAKLKDS